MATLKKNQMHKYLSVLDSDRFGFPVAKLNYTNEDPGQEIQELLESSTQLIIIRLNLSNIALINQFEEIGFKYKDTQLVFNYDLKKPFSESQLNGFSIRKFEVKHLDSLIEMTRKSFINYGHYFADGNLDKSKCLDIYVDWITRCCKDKSVADDVIVAEKNGKAIGYLAVKKFNEKSKYIAGVIGAVDPDHRKMGVFREINSECLRYALEAGATRFENNVLVSNLPVIKSYINLDFYVLRSEITMHYWKG